MTYVIEFVIHFRYFSLKYNHSDKVPTRTILCIAFLCHTAPYSFVLVRSVEINFQLIPSFLRIMIFELIDVLWKYMKIFSFAYHIRKFRKMWNTGTNIAAAKTHMEYICTASSGSFELDMVVRTLSPR